MLFFLHANICQQVQDIEFMQIEMKVIEGLKVGNDCLKSMHEVDIRYCFLSAGHSHSNDYVRFRNERNAV